MTPLEGLSIAQLAIYAPSFFLANFISFRHGFKRQRGWFYLIIFTVVRIAGNAITIDAISHPSKSKSIWGACLSAVGLSPLLLAQHGLIVRVFESMPPARAIPPRVVKLLEIIPLVGLILSIIGATKFDSDYKEARTYLKVGSILMLIVWVLQAMLCGYLIRFREAAPRGEWILIYAATAAVPFLLVRLIYSIIAVSSNNPKFSILSGNVGIRAGMGAAMEFIIVIIFLVAGLLVPKIPKNAATGTVNGSKDGQELGHDQGFDASLQEQGQVHYGSQNPPEYQKGQGYGQPAPARQY